MRWVLWPCLLSFLTICNYGFSTISQRLTEDIEFAVTSKDGQTIINSLQTRYDGANHFDLQPYRGIAQTFIVSAEITLAAVHLRIGDFSNVQCGGQFEVAVYGFNSMNGTFSSKVASAVANAGSYDGYETSDVPVSMFDFSSFNALLHESRTYALTVSPLESFTGRLTVQVQPNNYAGGQSMLFDAPIVIPEPATMALLALGALALTRKRK